MAEVEGWVYVLTNEAMPGLVKIGYTMKDPAIRAKDLSYETGVPIPYDVNNKALVVGLYQVEQEVHGKLDSKRRQVSGYYSIFSGCKLMKNW